MAPNGTSDAALLTELEQRSRGVAVGERADLGDLLARDPCGPTRFESLAKRFGWNHDDEGWVRERVPRWTPGWVEAHHEEQWMQLFEAAFDYRMAAPLWRWKYRHNPLPGMGAWRGGELVAFYGGMAREVLFFGRPEMALQIGDVMTRPDERAVMTRSGPFQLAASTLIERTFGMPYLLGYGFPTDKALKVAQRLGLYEQVDQMMELSWDAEDSFAARFDEAVTLQPEHQRTVDALWAGMAQAFKADVIGVRDWNYVMDRYPSHPLNRYECLLVRQRLTRRAKGVLVVRDHGGNDVGGVEILDLIGPVADWPDLIRAARRWIAVKGRTRAYLWVTKSHAPLLAGTAPQMREMELMVPANVWTAGPSAEELQGKWWLTGGDTDFR